MGHVIEILISSASSTPMEARESVLAVAGKGLQGDRYFESAGTFSPHPRKPDYELTLIENEQIAAFAAASGLPFTSHHARRNIVTEGVNLNSLVGVEFRIGEALIRGIRLCEPCNYLAKTTFPEVLYGLVHKGGLRAQIVTGGVIRVGDELMTRDKDEGDATDCWVNGGDINWTPRTGVQAE